MSGLSGSELAAITVIVLALFMLGRLPEFGFSLQRVARFAQDARPRPPADAEAITPMMVETDDVYVITPITEERE